ncbi:hypothetical protein ACFT7S_37795 [Streptomyces sp. NPDC057136]|uniref:hypothetical protein n=1 Tax=Streptomyces sp. NPDC057136 TaxID=3346029 RepID=UPI003640B300
MASPRLRAALRRRRRLPAYAAVLAVLGSFPTGLVASAPAAAVQVTEAPRPAHGSPAETGGNSERLWLLGGLGLALTGAGAVACAAARGRGHERDRG